MEQLLRKKRVLIGHLFSLLVLFGARQDARLQVIGAVLVFLGVVVRLWAAGCLYKDQTVTTTGPYCHLRNPLYLGSFLIFLGFTVMSAQMSLGVVFLFFFPPLYFFTMKSEEKFLLGKFPDDYKPYFQKVPRFLPRLMGAKDLPTSKPFSWDQVRYNKEYEGTVGSLAIMGLMIALTVFWPNSILGAIFHKFSR